MVFFILGFFMSVRKIFPTPLSPDEKNKLILLSRASGISMCGVLRQLLLREYAGTRLVRPHEQTVTRGGR